MRALQGVEAEVWVLATGGRSAQEEDRMAGLLDPGERARAARFAFPQDRRDYRFAHGLLRLLLSSASPRSPASWRFRSGAGGKPELARGEPGNLFFNISHTRGCVACLVGRRPYLGVDVESRARRTLSDLGERLFAPAEAALLRGLDEQERWERFFRIWTLKEAYLKGSGTGLRMPLDSFAFTLEPPRISFSSQLRDDADAWHFEQRLHQNTFIIAVSQREPLGPPPLRWRFLQEIPEAPAR